MPFPGEMIIFALGAAIVTFEFSRQAEKQEVKVKILHNDVLPLVQRKRYERRGPTRWVAGERGAVGVARGAAASGGAAAGAGGAAARHRPPRRHAANFRKRRASSSGRRRAPGSASWSRCHAKCDTSRHTSCVARQAARVVYVSRFQAQTDLLRLEKL